MLIISKVEIDALNALKPDYIATVATGTQVEVIQLKSGKWRAYLRDFITPWSPRGQQATSKEVVRDNYGYIITGATKVALTRGLKQEYPYWRYE